MSPKYSMSITRQLASNDASCYITGMNAEWTCASSEGYAPSWLRLRGLRGGRTSCPGRGLRPRVTGSGEHTQYVGEDELTVFKLATWRWPIAIIRVPYDPVDLADDEHAHALQFNINYWLLINESCGSCHLWCLRKLKPVHDNEIICFLLLPSSFLSYQTKSISVK